MCTDTAEWTPIPIDRSVIVRVLDELIGDRDRLRAALTEAAEKLAATDGPDALVDRAVEVTRIAREALDATRPGRTLFESDGTPRPDDAT